MTEILVLDRVWQMYLRVLSLSWGRGGGGESGGGTPTPCAVFTKLISIRAKSVFNQQLCVRALFCAHSRFLSVPEAWCGSEMQRPPSIKTSRGPFSQRWVCGAGRMGRFTRGIEWTECHVHGQLQFHLLAIVSATARMQTAVR